jgi:hypothetical protein
MTMMSERIKRLLRELALDPSNPQILRELLAALEENPEDHQKLEEIRRWLRR